MQQNPHFDFGVAHHRTRNSIFRLLNQEHTLGVVFDSGVFEKQIVNKWYPDKTPMEVTIQFFGNTLRSLLAKSYLFQEKNISLPSSETPFSCISCPEVDKISELHHGKWWADTWRTKCNKDSNKILVPIILYMDGISIDAHGRLTLTPLNVTLGIFNTAARKLPEAWETIYFHPDKKIMTSR